MTRLMKINSRLLMMGMYNSPCEIYSCNTTLLSSWKTWIRDLKNKNLTH